MAFTIPTTKQLYAQFLSFLESRINQTTPPVARAFNKVLSAALSMFGTGLYKYVGNRALQVFALTATGEDLDIIGENYGVVRRSAVAAILEARLTATSGTIIPLGTKFTSNATNEIYTTIEEITANAFDYALLNIQASTPGEDGNLSVGEDLSIGTPIAGANSVAYIVADETTDGVVVAGTDREEDSVYRRRVLTRMRAAGGGGNAADYREWGEAVDDVARVFPYAGKPITFTATDDFSIDDNGGGGPYVVTYEGAIPTFSFIDLGFHPDGVVTISDCSESANNASWGIISVTADELTLVGPLTAVVAEEMTLVNESLPGDRTAYVESISTPDEASPALLDAVREALLIDPDTGLARIPLGLVDDRLYVESIYRSAITVYVVGLDVAAEIETEVRAKITASITDYVSRVCCFVGGLDFPADRSDGVSSLSLSTVVQGILRGVGGSAELVVMEIDAVEYDLYQLKQGELLELSTPDPVQFIAEWPIP
jgi:hypothetical protein